MTNVLRRRPLNVLTLTGGGAKVFYALGVLKELERHRKSPIMEAVDVIVGTSAGALLGGSLAIGKTLDESRSIIEGFGHKIFPPHRKSRRPYLRSKYNGTQIRDAAEFLFEGRSFDSADKPLFVVAQDFSTRRPLFIGGGDGVNHYHFGSANIGEAVLASMSAPTYFPFRKYEFPLNDRENEGTEGWLIDGGMVANNPDIFAAIELSQNYSLNFDEIRILSIGTMFQKPRRVEAGFLKQRKWGYRQWLLPPNTGLLIDSVLQGQEILAERLCESLLADDFYVRIDTSTEAPIALDDYEMRSEFIALGEKSAREYLDDALFGYRLAAIVHRK